MTTPLTSIRNIGPATAADLTRAGIESAEALREMGPDAAYSALLRHGTRPHFIGYYVLVMALQGRPWNDCKTDEKALLRKRFDQIKADAFDTGLFALEKALDDIGVRARQ